MYKKQLLLYLRREEINDDGICKQSAVFLTHKLSTVRLCIHTDVPGLQRKKFRKSKIEGENRGKSKMVSSLMCACRPKNMRAKNAKILSLQAKR